MALFRLTASVPQRLRFFLAPIDSVAIFLFVRFLSGGLFIVVPAKSPKVGWRVSGVDVLARVKWASQGACIRIVSRKKYSSSRFPLRRRSHDTYYQTGHA